MKISFWTEARASFHAALFESVLVTDKNNVPSSADKHSKYSVEIARGIVSRLGKVTKGVRLAGQMSGNRFEKICEEYVRQTFLKLEHLRPGNWEIGRLGAHFAITTFDQYEHLAHLSEAAKEDAELAAALGIDYLIKPDVVIVRYPEDDSRINSRKAIVGRSEAKLTSLRNANGPKPTLHASISCKWTLRSDRAQNARAEALNLVRNRKGRLPHVVAIVGEPTPHRIASLALGTGDIDCVYHFALHELVETVEDLKYEDAAGMLDTLIRGKRLRDISDLPFDLVI